MLSAATHAFVRLQLQHSAGCLQVVCAVCCCYRAARMPPPSGARCLCCAGPMFWVFQPPSNVACRVLALSIRQCLCLRRASVYVCLVLSICSSIWLFLLALVPGRRHVLPVMVVRPPWVFTACVCVLGMCPCASVAWPLGVQVCGQGRKTSAAQPCTGMLAHCNALLLGRLRHTQ